MSEIERFVPAIEGVVTCTATASSCRCVLPSGHDSPHECDPDVCGGRWSGSPDDDDFEVYRFPLGFPPLNLLG